MKGRQSGDPESVADRNGTDDCGLHYRHAVSRFLVVMDVLGPETSVTFRRTYRHIRWRTPVIRRLERKKTKSGGMNSAAWPRIPTSFV